MDRCLWEMQYISQIFVTQIHPRLGSDTAVTTCKPTCLFQITFCVCVHMYTFLQKGDTLCFMSPKTRFYFFVLVQLHASIFFTPKIS